MTTIVGAVSGERVFLAADRQVTDHNNYTTEVTKLFHKGQLLIGISGDYKATTVLQHLPPGKLKYESDPRKFMAITFPRIVREFLDAQEIILGPYDALIGTKGHLFHFDSTEEYSSPLLSYHAIGSGAPFAIGSMATSGRAPALKPRLTTAVEIACRFDAQSGGAVEILSI